METVVKQTPLLPFSFPLLYINFHFQALPRFITSLLPAN
jgi:hypothetical protein